MRNAVKTFSPRGGATSLYVLSGEANPSGPVPSAATKALTGYVGNPLNDGFTLLHITKWPAGLNSIRKGCQKARAAASKNEPGCQRLFH